MSDVFEAESETENPNKFWLWKSVRITKMGSGYCLLVLKNPHTCLFLYDSKTLILLLKSSLRMVISAFVRKTWKSLVYFCEIERTPTYANVFDFSCKKLNFAIICTREDPVLRRRFFNCRYKLHLLYQMAVLLTCQCFNIYLQQQVSQSYKLLKSARVYLGKAHLKTTANFLQRIKLVLSRNLEMGYTLFKHLSEHRKNLPEFWPSKEGRAEKNYTWCIWNSVHNLRKKQ